MEIIVAREKDLSINYHIVLYYHFWTQGRLWQQHTQTTIFFFSRSIVLHLELNISDIDEVWFFSSVLYYYGIVQRARNQRKWILNMCTSSISTLNRFQITSLSPKQIKELNSHHKTVTILDNDFNNGFGEAMIFEETFQIFCPGVGWNVPDEYLVATHVVVVVVVVVVVLYFTPMNTENMFLNP